MGASTWTLPAASVGRRFMCSLPSSRLDAVEHRACHARWPGSFVLVVRLLADHSRSRQTLHPNVCYAVAQRVVVECAQAWPPRPLAGVLSTGHCHPRVVSAIQQQAGEIIMAQQNILPASKAMVGRRGAGVRRLAVASAAPNGQPGSGAYECALQALALLAAPDLHPYR